MGIALFILIASLVICPIVTVVKGFILVNKERHEEYVQKMGRMIRSALVSRHAAEIREAAMFYGIDSNEADIDAADLLEHREMLVKYLGRKTYNKINQHINNGGPKLPSYKVFIYKRHCVNHVLDVAALIAESQYHAFHLVMRGGDIDGEPASRNI